MIYMENASPIILNGCYKFEISNVSPVTLYIVLSKISIAIESIKALPMAWRD